MVRYEVYYGSYIERQKITDFLESWADMLNGTYKILENNKAEIIVDDKQSSRERKIFERNFGSFIEKGLLIKVN